MAIENQAAVRGTHRTHHPTAGAAKGAATSEDAGAAAGFSALLGAVADDTDVLDTGLSIPVSGAGLMGAGLTGNGRRLAPSDDANGNDAAALAAWAGLLQQGVMPALPGTRVAGATAATAALAAPTSTASTTSAATPTFTVAPTSTASTASTTSTTSTTSTASTASTTSTASTASTAAPTAPTSTAAAAVLNAAPGQFDLSAGDTPAATAGPPGLPGAARLLSPDVAAPLNAAISSVSTAFAALAVPAESLPAAVQSAPQSLPPNPAAVPMGIPQSAAGLTLRPGAVPAQAAPGRAHAATVAADHAAGQGAALANNMITASATEAPTVRGASSTVSMGEGGQGRWAGMLSDIVRPVQAEAGAAGFSGGGSQGQERGRGGDSRSADGMATATGALGFAPTAGGTDGGFAAGTAAADGPAMNSGMVMTPDEWLAATTAPLGSRSLQTAELTVDAFGAPVDVTISLNGAEAQVGFQSDQADTRALLGGAVSDLQSLLQQEGLVLSGVSVGSSHGGQAGNTPGFSGDAGEGRHRPRGGDSMRITPDISASTPVAAASARSAAATARGGLDLFA